MPLRFLDSSAAVKRYVDEAGSAWVLGITSPSRGNSCYVVRITGVEVVSAITRRARGGSLAASDAAMAVERFRSDFANEFRCVEMSRGLIERAMDLAEKHALRGYDAVQLAAALEVQAGITATGGGPPLILVSADADLNSAAVMEGLAVEDPNAHP